MKIIKISKTNGSIKSLEKARDLVKKASKELRDEGVHSNITSIGFDLDEAIYKLEND